MVTNLACWVVVKCNVIVKSKGALFFGSSVCVVVNDFHGSSKKFDFLSSAGQRLPLADCMP